MPVPSARRGALRRRLLAWYDAGQRRLPWRFPQGAADPYRVWIAEVMLQQTRVEAAIPYYERFVARLPTIEALAAAPEEEVLALFAGLGYYARARNLARAAREARARHGGLPASLAALRALPGFGPYTAGAVASIAFGVPTAAVDGNVARVLARLFLVDGPAESAGVRRRIGAIASALAGERTGAGARGAAPGAERPGDWNQALMDLGATVCGKPVPACGRCPVASLCEARRRGRERDVPRARRRATRSRAVLACALVRRGEAVLVARRPAGGLFGGLWGPPAVEVAPGADARRALDCALRAEHALAAAVGGEVASCERTLTHRALTLRAFRCELREAVRPPLRWARPADLRRIGIPTAVRVLLERARRRERTDPPARGTAGEGTGRARTRGR